MSRTSIFPLAKMLPDGGTGSPHEVVYFVSLPRRGPSGEVPLCPLLSLSRQSGAKECIESSCAWWDEELDRCVMYTIAEKLAILERGLYDQLDALNDILAKRQEAI